MDLESGRRQLDSALAGLSLAEDPALTEYEEEVYEQEVICLPDHACRYCTVHNPTAVVKCCACNKWFCNGRQGGAGSHIVQHLVRSKHKELALHADSLVGETVIECYACGNRNVFGLGWVTGKDEPTMVVILCRVLCPHAAAKTGEWDPNTWSPLVEERAMTSLLVNAPNEADLLRARKTITAADMTRLEEVWKKHPDAVLEDCTRYEEEAVEELPVQLRYEDPHLFGAIFEPLVRLEADYDRELKEAQSLKNVSVRWDTGMNQRRIAWLSIGPIASNPGAVDPDFRMTVGDEVIIEHEQTAFKVHGMIIEVPLGPVSEEIAVEVAPGGRPCALTSQFVLRFVWKSVPYDRMTLALMTFCRDEQAMSEILLKKLLGHECEMPAMAGVQVPKSVNVPGLPALNPSQSQAVRAVLARPLSLIQGPPGTGKTVTSAAVIYHLAQQTSEAILVCAPSNVAVDHLAEKMHAAGLRVVRLAARSRENVQTGVEHLSLHEMLKNSDAFPELNKLFELKAQMGHLKDADEKRMIQLRFKAEAVLLNAAQVVCCTCSGAGDKRLMSRKFSTVLIDEATQACEPECLIPLVRGARQVVLVGDHRQLGPVILNKRAAKAGLNQSLFERLIKLGIKPVRLQVQYRMHPCLSEFPSNHFYDGSLENGVGASERASSARSDFPWFNPDLPMMFVNCTGQEELAGSGTSFLNRGEALMVEKVVTRLLRSGTEPTRAILPTSIGVITPYEGQRVYTLQAMQQHGPLSKDLYTAVEVASVDAFQGREKDYIVLSCVRSNDHGGIGFLQDPRRLNVALTRAKYGLVILGNARLLAKHPLWHSLLGHFKSKNLLLEGTVLTGLRPSVMALRGARGLDELGSLQRMPELSSSQSQPYFAFQENYQL